ncbi:tyrosine-type recombinase/integrase [Teichococcus aestuarii]
MAHAIDLGWRDTDPTHGVKRQRHKAVGYATWSEDEIAAYEARWPSGSRERLAFALLLYTGQRRSDVVRMGWPQVRNEAIDLKQVKTGTALAIPIHPDLATELTFTPRDQPTFLQRQNGAAFTANGFYMRFIGWCEKAGIPQGRSPHGLRKAAARRLAEAGCTAHQIAAITGHRSLSEVERYTKAADQVRLATAAMARITRSKLQTPKEKLQTEDENGG